MNTKRLSAALVFALVCSGLLTWQIGKHLTPVAPKERPVSKHPIVVASEDIRAGEMLSSASGKSVNLPANEFLPGELRSSSELAGQVAQVAIRLGEPIFAHDLAPTTMGTGLAVSIPGGMRAITLRGIDQNTGSYGFVVPGSFVDVLVTYRTGLEGSFISSMVLQDARVLAVGKDTDVGADAKMRTEEGVTFLLTPEEAEQLTAASSIGKITLSLRNTTDRTIISERRFMKTQTTSEDPRRPIRPAVAAQTAVKRPAAAAFAVETLSGGKTTTQTFQGEQ